MNTVASFLCNQLELVAGAKHNADGITSHVLRYSGDPLKWKICESPGSLMEVHPSATSDCTALRNGCVDARVDSAAFEVVGVVPHNTHVLAVLWHCIVA